MFDNNVIQAFLFAHIPILPQAVGIVVGRCPGSQLTRILVVTSLESKAYLSKHDRSAKKTLQSLSAIFWHLGGHFGYLRFS